MDAFDELKSVSPLRSPSLASSRAIGASSGLHSTRSVVSTTPTIRMSPTKSSSALEMSVTEQIARKTRKSTVLDEKNALLILAIPDYDDYKILQPYSCRSLSNKSKFVGGKDFVTRHNPQEVNDFKMQYSRDVGNLNRHRSILAPPTALVAGAVSPSGAKSFAFLASQALGTIASSNQSALDGAKAIWKKAFTAGNKHCWILTDYGIEQLIGPEYSITTRVALTTARDEPSPQTCRSPLRPETPFAVFTARESARIGMGVNLLDEKALQALSHSAAYSPASRPASPPRSPYREPMSSVTHTERLPSRESTTSRRLDSSREELATGSRADFRLGSPLLGAPTPRELPHMSPLRTKDIFRHEEPRSSASSPTLLPFAMEVSPPCICLGTLEAGEVYLFPVRVRNVGSKQERYRVKHVSASAGGQIATIAEASYDKESARLAAGLAAIVTVTLSFQRRGQISGQLRVDTEGVGVCDVRIEGHVR